MFGTFQDTFLTEHNHDLSHGRHIIATTEEGIFSTQKAQHYYPCRPHIDG
jgi:hypothetical protein